MKKALITLSKLLSSAPGKGFGISIALAMLLLSSGSAFAYCIPGTNIGCAETDQYVHFFTSGGVTNIDHNPGNFCFEQNSHGYATFSGPGLSASGNIGNTITVSITNGVIYEEAYAIWVDWNQNGVFDPGEEVYFTPLSYGGGQPANTTFTGTFTIPPGAALGTTTLRIRCLFAVPSSCVTPCGPDTCDPNYGVSVDFPFTVLGSPATPTLSEWGLILFSLLLLSFGMVFVYRRQSAMVLAGAMAEEKPATFDRSLYFKALGGVMLVAIAGMFAAYRYFGTLSITDTLGTLASACVVAYMVQLSLLMRKKQD